MDTEVVERYQEATAMNEMRPHAGRVSSRCATALVTFLIDYGVVCLQ